MKTNKSSYALLAFAAVLGVLAIIGCSVPGGGTAPASVIPTVSSTAPLNLATDVPLASAVSATFSDAMDATTIVATNFAVTQNGITVPGAVSYNAANKTVTFIPTVAMANSKVYIATVTTGVKSSTGNALAANRVWTFTSTAATEGPLTVSLGSAGNFVILGKTSVTTIGTTAVTGDLGLSPAATSLFTGFSQTMDSTFSFATSTYVTGKLYAADMFAPTPANLTTAIGNMQTAYTDAAGRPSVAANTGVGGGTLSGVTLYPGVYTWTKDVSITTSITLSGDATATWIFQIPGNLTVANPVQIILAGGAVAKNVFWQVAGNASLGAGSSFVGNILCKTDITFVTGSKFTGRALSQTAVNLQAATITKP